MSNVAITLCNGMMMPVVMKPEQPENVTEDNLELDTSGEYLSLGKRKSKRPADTSKRDLEQSLHSRLLVENARFLLAHSKEIFADGMRFLAPLNIGNHLAYTGESGLKHPTLGIYVEWWLQGKEGGIDDAGNLIWYIAGSPLSGSNACKAVDEKGESVKMDSRTGFSRVWHSFMDLNQYYTPAKQRCEALAFEEVLVALRGEEYRTHIERLRAAILAE